MIEIRADGPGEPACHAFVSDAYAVNQYIDTTQVAGSMPWSHHLRALEDRLALAQNIDEAHKAGACWRLACQTAGISVRTLQRWKAEHG